MSNNRTAPQPDVASPLRFLRWLASRRRGLVAASAAIGAVWIIPGATLPFVVGLAVDQGLRSRSTSSLLTWCGTAFGLVVLQAIAGSLLNRAAALSGLHASVTTQRVVSTQVAELGSALPKQMRVGEVITISTSDVNNLGTGFEVAGRALGSVFGFLLVSMLLLLTSPVLGLALIVGVPLTILGIGPLLRPLRERNQEQRDTVDASTARSADIVYGLRVLRGIGGERKFEAQFVDLSQLLRRAGETAGRSAAWLNSAGVLLPGLVTVVITWLGARLVISGTISPGALVTFYGLSTFLWIAVSNVTDAAGSLSIAYVAARRVCSLMRLPVSGSEEYTELDEAMLSLRDEVTGLVIKPGALTVVSGSVEVSHALAARLAGYRSVSTETETKDFARGGVNNRTSSEEVGGEVWAKSVPLRRVDPATLRQRIVLAGQTDTLFSGPLRAELTATQLTQDGPDFDQALAAAQGEDIIDTLPEGAHTTITRSGRLLSGGQRQRLILARALYAAPEILILDNPTSTVDSPTEAVIAEAVAKVRRGRTTVVLSRSALWWSVADHVHHLDSVRPDPSAESSDPVINNHLLGEADS